uniref:Uncharacterized protein n=1 Tax=Ditylenchus dipsaci TaxID=166011 RepID=A0A915E050_9BILA
MSLKNASGSDRSASQGSSGFDSNKLLTTSGRLFWLARFRLCFASDCCRLSFRISGCPSGCARLLRYVGSGLDCML